jgi:hypothetical protein
MVIVLAMVARAALVSSPRRMDRTRLVRSLGAQRFQTRSRTQLQLRLLYECKRPKPQSGPLPLMEAWQPQSKSTTIIIPRYHMIRSIDHITVLQGISDEQDVRSSWHRHSKRTQP